MGKFRQFNTRSAVLKPEQVLAIRQEYEEGATQRELCRKYGVSLGTIGRVVRGETWQQFQGPRAEHISVVADDAPEILESQARLQAMLKGEPTAASQEPSASETALERLQSDLAAAKKPDAELDEFLMGDASKYGFSDKPQGKTEEDDK